MELAGVAAAVFFFFVVAGVLIEFFLVVPAAASTAVLFLVAIGVEFGSGLRRGKGLASRLRVALAESAG